MYGIFYLHFAIKKSTNINPASPSNRGLVSVVSVFTSLPSEDLFGGTSAVVSQPGSGWKVTSSAEIGSWWCALEQLNLRGGVILGATHLPPPKEKGVASYTSSSGIRIRIQNHYQDSESESSSSFSMGFLLLIIRIQDHHHFSNSLEFGWNRATNRLCWIFFWANELFFSGFDNESLLLVDTFKRPRDILSKWQVVKNAMTSTS